MTRRKLIFKNPHLKTWVVSDTFTGDRAELEKTGSMDACDHTWEEFLDGLAGVDTLPGFLSALSLIWRSYHSFLPKKGDLPAPRLSFAHDLQELRALTDGADEIWELSPPTPGAHLFDFSHPPGYQPPFSFCHNTIPILEAFK